MGKSHLFTSENLQWIGFSGKIYRIFARIFHGKIMENPWFPVKIFPSNPLIKQFWDRLRNGHRARAQGAQGAQGAQVNNFLTPRLWRCSATISISRSMQRRCDEWRVVLLLFQLPTLCRLCPWWMMWMAAKLWPKKNNFPFQGSNWL